MFSAKTQFWEEVEILRIEYPEYLFLCYGRLCSDVVFINRLLFEWRENDSTLYLKLLITSEF